MSKNLKTKKLRKHYKKNKSFVFLRIMIVSVFFAIGIFNLLQINHKTTLVYKTDSLENKIEKLKNKKETMELEASKLQSLASVYKRLDIN
ncbi:MAG: hypothetical protein GWO87_00515 [Xanthomonadaceae bacterium]|nr:hypothetical protein [Rhodospirillaceae bacterium]NIA17663.1 hypothetical protein [Xanthomonadaceae bacterium]